MKQALTIGLVLVLATGAAIAGPTTVLDDPVVGQSQFEAWGTASKDVRSNVEIFRVRVDALLQDGSMLTVAIRRNGGSQGPSEWTDVGLMEVRLGTSLMSLNSRRDVSPAFPISGLVEVMIKYRGRAILKGHF